MTLAETQARFHALVTGPARARAARAGSVVCGTRALPAAARLRIYADMWRWRQVDALADDFPALAALLGRAGFERLADAYLAAHPSDRPDLGQLGRALARHLRATRTARPELADLAALEWARAEALLEGDAEPVSPNALAAVPPRRFARARLRLVPALRVLRLRHDVLPVWRALRREEAPPAPARGEFAAVVWRQGFEVVHAAIPPDEARALAAAARGRPLHDVLAAFAARPDPAAAAFAALATWVREGLVRAVGLRPARRARRRGASRTDARPAPP